MILPGKGIGKQYTSHVPLPHRKTAFGQAEKHTLKIIMEFLKREQNSLFTDTKSDD